MLRERMKGGSGFRPSGKTHRRTPHKMVSKGHKTAAAYLTPLCDGLAAARGLTPDSVHSLTQIICKVTPA
jgi:hypothetical protein